MPTQGQFQQDFSVGSAGICTATNKANCLIIQEKLKKKEGNQVENKEIKDANNQVRSSIFRPHFSHCCIYSPFRHLAQAALTRASSHHRPVLDVLRMWLKLLDYVVQATAGSARLGIPCFLHIYPPGRTEAPKRLLRHQSASHCWADLEGWAGQGQRAPPRVGV